MTREFRSDDGRYVVQQRDNSIVVYDTAGPRGWIPVWDQRSYEVASAPYLPKPLPPDPPRIG